MPNRLKYKQIKNLIDTNGGKFMTIRFIKKDGSLRTMNFQAKGGVKHMAGDAASASSQQAVATRKINNPNLLNVWEQNNPDDETKFRSINMDTVTQVSCGKMSITFSE